MKLSYYTEHPFNEYRKLYHYDEHSISEDEIYARQLCTYFIKDGNQYQLKSNEMENDIETLILEEQGKSPTFSEDRNYAGQGIHIEFRLVQSFNDMPLLFTLSVQSHWEVIRYLLKDVVEVPRRGLMVSDSTEIDEDRHVYVIYVSELEE